MSLFPVFLKLERRKCLVVGGGTAALEKIKVLRRAGASITVVSPRAVAALSKLSDTGTIQWQARRFQPEDLDGVQLVIAATNDRQANRSIFAEASRRFILCNTVDDPALCDFFCAAIVDRGDLQIAISTAGKSPALAQRLKKEIDEQLDPELGRWLDDLGALRREVLAAIPPGEIRKQLLHRLAQRELCRAADCPARRDAFADGAEMSESCDRSDTEEAPR